ncbi:MAG: prephenate dehydrogenase [Oscillospiraceae bacterium]
MQKKDDLYNIKNVLIVGLGLIGGSYAKALKKCGYTIFGTDIDSKAITFAKDNNIIKDGNTNPKQLIYDADLIVLCLYPQKCYDFIKENYIYFKNQLLITDVCGVKNKITQSIFDLIELNNNYKNKQVEFLASHPMAGREVSGIIHSDENIFINANFIITPLQSNSIKAIETLKFIAGKMGFGDISVLSVKQHDEIIGYVSQLTHTIAVALMLANDSENLSKYTGDSFRDLTRIAKINENLWCELFLSNKEILCDEIDNFIASLNLIKETIKNGNENQLKELLKKSTERRKLFDKI